MKKVIIATFALLFQVNVCILAHETSNCQKKDSVVQKISDVKNCLEGGFDYPCPICACSTCWELYYDGNRIIGGKCLNCGLEFEILSDRNGNAIIVTRKTKQVEEKK